MQVVDVPEFLRSETAAESPAPHGPPAIELVGASKRFGATRAVDGVTLSAASGEILALLGPSGSGKTSLLRLLAGFERPDAGCVAVGGRVVAEAGGAWEPPERRRIGMVFQDLALFPHLTVAANVGFGLAGLDRGRRVERVREVLGLVELSELAERYPHELSGGQQQRVALGRALAPSPAVVLLDEPFSSLDPDLRDRVREDVRRILRAAGATAVLVTHDQDEALSMADRVAVMNGGRLEQVDTPLELYQRPATRFVAAFVGRADFLPGRVTAGGLATEVGDVLNPGVAPDEAVEVLVRPHEVLLVADAAGPAIVESRRFQGSDALYALRLPSGRVLRSRRPAAEEAHPPGARVKVVLCAPYPTLFCAGRVVGRPR